MLSTCIIFVGTSDIFKIHLTNVYHFRDYVFYYLPL